MLHFWTAVYSEGKNKKEAEISAARDLLVQLGEVSVSPSGRNHAASEAMMAIARPWSLDKWLSCVVRASAGFERVPPFVDQLKRETGIELDARLADVATGHASTRPPGRDKLFGAVETGLEVLGNAAYTLSLLQDAVVNIGLAGLESSAANGALAALHTRLNDNAFKREFGRRWLPAFRTGDGFKGAMSDQVLSDLFEGVLGALTLQSLGHFGLVEKFVSRLLIEQVDYSRMSVRVAGHLAKKDSVSVLQQLLQLIPTGAEFPALPSRFRFSKSGADHKALFRCFVPIGNLNAFVGQGDTKTTAFAESADLLLKVMAPRLTDQSLPPIGIPWADQCIANIRDAVFGKRERVVITRLSGYRKLKVYNPAIADLACPDKGTGEVNDVTNKPQERVQRSALPLPATIAASPRSNERTEPVEKPDPAPEPDVEVSLQEIPVARLLEGLSREPDFKVAFLGFSGQGGGFALSPDAPCVLCHKDTLVSLLRELTRTAAMVALDVRVDGAHLNISLAPVGTKAGGNPGLGIQPSGQLHKRVDRMVHALAAELERDTDGTAALLRLPLTLDSIDSFAPSNLDELL